MTPRDPALVVAEAVHHAYDVGEDQMEHFPSAYTLAKAILQALRNNSYAIIDLGELVD